MRRLLPSDAEPALVARWCGGAGLALAQLGRSAGALSVTEEAVAIYRKLADTDPDRYRPDLADFLSDLAAILSSLDGHSEADQARREARS